MTDFLPAGNMLSLQIKQTCSRVALPHKGTEKTHGWQRHTLCQQLNMQRAAFACCRKRFVLHLPPLWLCLYTVDKNPQIRGSHRWNLDKREQLDISKDTKLRKFILSFKGVTSGGLTAGEQVPWLSQGFRLKMWLTSVSNSERVQFPDPLQERTRLLQDKQCRW